MEKEESSTDAVLQKTATGNSDPMRSKGIVSPGFFGLISSGETVHDKISLDFYTLDSQKVAAKNVA